MVVDAMLMYRELVCLFQTTAPACGWTAADVDIMEHSKSSMNDEWDS